MNEDTQAKDMFPLVALAWSFILFFNQEYSFPLQTMMGMMALFSWLSWILFEKFHWSIGVSFFYFSITAIARICFPTYFYQGFALENIIGFASLVTEGHIYLTAVVFGFFFMRRKQLEFVENLMITFAFINTAFLWVRFLFGHTPYFLFNNPSLDVVFTSMCLPLIWSKLKGNARFSMLFLLPPLIFTQTSSGILGLGLFFGLPLLRMGSPVLWSLCCSALAGLGYYMQGDTLLNSSGRVLNWKQYMSFWWEGINHWIGYGSGVTWLLGPAINVDNTKNLEGAVVIGFAWAHSDIIQTLFETGYLGLLCLIIVYFSALWESRKSPVVFDSLVIYAAFASFQMPFRFVIMTCFGALLLTHAFRPAQESTH